VSGRVFLVIGTASRVFALDEQVDFGGAGLPALGTGSTGAAGCTMAQQARDLPM